MALSAFIDSFAISTGAVGTTQARTGYGFSPVALIVWHTLNQSLTDVVTGGLVDVSFGFATSATSRRCIANAFTDAAATSDTARAMRTDAIGARVSSGASITALLDISSIDVDGATFIIDDTYTAAQVAHVLAIGGADVTNAAIVDFAASTSAGTQAVTGVGFQPDSLIILSVSNTTSGNLVATHALMSIGIVSAATASGNAIWSAAAVDAASPIVAKSYCRNGESLVGFSTAGALSGRGYVSSFDSDGFTITWTANPATAIQFYVLAIKGGTFSVGDVLTQTDTTTDITESGLSFSPVAGLLLSHCKAASSAGTIDADYHLSVGAFTGATSEFASGVSTLDAQNPTVSARGVEFDNCYMHISSSDTLDGAMNITSVDSGGYTARMSDADPAQSFVAHLLFGSAASGVTTKTMTETFSMVDAALDPTYRTRLMSESMVMTDTSVFWRTCFRWMDEAATLIDEAVKSVISGSGLFVKVMTDTLAAADSLVQWLLRVRGPIDSVTITDGDLYRTSIITANDSFDTADGIVTWRRLKRFVEDNFALIDSFSKTLTGAGIVYAKVLSDSITLIDDAGQRWTFRGRQLSDTSEFSDQVIQTLIRIRLLGEDVEFSDGAVKIRMLGRSLDENIEVGDDLVSTLYLDQMSSVSFSFGSSGPPFRFGGE